MYEDERHLYLVASAEPSMSFTRTYLVQNSVSPAKRQERTLAKITPACHEKVAKRCETITESSGRKLDYFLGWRPPKNVTRSRNNNRDRPRPLLKLSSDFTLQAETVMTCSTANSCNVGHGAHLILFISPMNDQTIYLSHLVQFKPCLSKAVNGNSVLH